MNLRNAKQKLNERDVLTYNNNYFIIKDEVVEHNCNGCYFHKPELLNYACPEGDADCEWSCLSLNRKDDTSKILIKI